MLGLQAQFVDNLCLDFEEAEAKSSSELSWRKYKHFGPLIYVLYKQILGILDWHSKNQDRLINPLVHIYIKIMHNSYVK